MLWLSDNILGKFDGNHGGIHTALFSDDKIVRTRAQFDLAEQDLKNGNLSNSIDLVNAIVNNDQSHQKQLGAWLIQAKARLTKEKNLEVLQKYTEKLICD